MVRNLFTYFRLSLRLYFDRKVNFWLKLTIPLMLLGYFLVPSANNFVPFAGRIDDAILAVIGGWVFMAAAPVDRVEFHRRQMQRSRRQPKGQAAPAETPAIPLDSLRYPSESRDLALGFGISCLLLALFGYAAGVLMALLIVAALIGTRLSRARTLANAIEVSENQFPELNRAFEAARLRLPDVDVHLLVTQNPVMNAYTFGMEAPYTLVLTSGLVEKTNMQEIQAVIGHELGHILFGHTRLINLMGGMPSLLQLIYMRWSRSCEYTCDAVALKACGNRLQPVVTLLLKITSGLKDVPVDLDSFLAQIEAQGTKRTAHAAEWFSTHPFINHRIRRLIELARSSQEDTPEMTSPTRWEYA